MTTKLQKMREAYWLIRHVEQQHFDLNAQAGIYFARALNCKTSELKDKP